jgi:NAD(P)H-dependent flavin oxidoreductase YrpB (nitropropane dioxygenase family)
MDFLHNIQLIQGGMGVYVSNFRLANAVAACRPGVTAGTVSGTALDVVYVRLLQLGDPGGYIRSGLAAFDNQFQVDIGAKIIDQYLIPGGKSPGDRYQYSPWQTLNTLDGSQKIPLPGDNPLPIRLSVDQELVELLIATAFAEVWLAKRGHQGRILINFLHKVQLPLMYALYGAMLADVDGIVVGAGNPEGLPQICSRLAQHLPVNTEHALLYRESGESFQVDFDPHEIASSLLTKKPLNSPAFIAIVSLESLLGVLANSPTEPPDGFIIEHHTAGGHNAPPLGPLQKDALGQPIYGSQDEPDLEEIRRQDRPFWLAGGYNSREKLQAARKAGAAGVQIGTSFALAQESGLAPVHKTALLDSMREGASDAELVRTTLFSPTGFPFKVAQLPGTLAEETVYEQRTRVCDLGFLQQRGFSKPNPDGNRDLFQRCPAGQLADFTRKRGLSFNAEGKRCLCNGLLAAVGLGQNHPAYAVEPAIVTLGNDLEGVRRLSRQGQMTYWACDVVRDLLK